jgi:Zn-dependent peptidase ImmA (M78 family)/DNA-binding XRE family transcriptional regulator
MVAMEVALKPEVLRWARERAGLTRETLAQKIGTKAERVREWEKTGRLRFKQAEKLAKATFTPFGQLYLPVPPEDRLPIPDFRTLGDAEIRRPSPELIDVLDDTLQRKDWYRDYLRREGDRPLAFVGSLNVQTPIAEAAERVRAVVGFDLAARAQARTWEEALTQQIERIESSGVLVMRTGIVRSNTHRPLSVDEFRGFALADDVAPVIFLNGRDALAAQMFTLAHELVHIFLGASGVSNLERTYAVARAEERFCNQVAAELLVPEASLRAMWPEAQRQQDRIAWLVQRFKVSSLVVLRRLHDLALIDRNAFDRLYRAEVARFRALAEAKAGGGDFYRTQRTRSGRRFARALIASALEGRTPYRDALRLLGISKTATFNEFARQLGFPA